MSLGYVPVGAEHREWQPFLDMTTHAFQFWVPQGVFAARELNRTRTM